MISQDELHRNTTVNERANAGHLSTRIEMSCIVSFVDSCVSVEYVGPFNTTMS